MADTDASIPPDVEVPTPNAPSKGRLHRLKKKSKKKKKRGREKKDPNHKKNKKRRRQPTPDESVLDTACETTLSGMGITSSSSVDDTVSSSGAEEDYFGNVFTEKLGRPKGVHMMGHSEESSEESSSSSAFSLASFLRREGEDIEPPSRRTLPSATEPATGVQITPENIGDIMEKLDVGMENVWTFPIPYAFFSESERYGDLRWETPKQMAIKSLLFLMIQSVHNHHKTLTEEEIHARNKEGTGLSPYYFITEIDGERKLLPRVSVFEQAECCKHRPELTFYGVRLFFVALDKSVNFTQLFLNTLNANRDDILGLKTRKKREDSREDSWTDYRCAKRIISPDHYFDAINAFEDAYIKTCLSDSDETFANCRARTLDASNYAQPMHIFSLLSMSPPAGRAEPIFMNSAFVTETYGEPLCSIGDFFRQEGDTLKFVFPYPETVKTVLRADLNPENFSGRKAPSSCSLSAIQKEERNRVAEIANAYLSNNMESPFEQECSQSAFEAMKKASSLLGIDDFEEEEEEPMGEGEEEQGLVEEEEEKGDESTFDSELFRNNLRFEDLTYDQQLSIYDQFYELDTIERLKKDNVEAMRNLLAQKNIPIQRLEDQKNVLLQQLETPVSEYLIKGMTTEERADLMSQIRTIEQNMQKMKLERIKAVQQLRDRMSRHLYSLLTNSDQDGVSFSKPIKAVIRHYAELTNNGVDGTNFWFCFRHGQDHSNLSYFGSVIVRLWTAFHLCCRIKSSGDNVRHLLNILVACFSSWFFEMNPASQNPTEDDQVYQYTMKGEYESSKTFLMRCVSSVLIPERVLEVTYATELSRTVARFVRDTVQMNHEANADFLGGGNGKHESFVVKDSVKGYMITNRCIKDEDGQQKLDEQLTIWAPAVVNATNEMSIINDSGALNTRQQVVRKEKVEKTIPSERINMNKLVNELIGKELIKMMAPFTRIMRSIEIVMGMTAQCVRARIIEPINSDAYKILSTAVQDELLEMGFDEESLVRDIKRGRILSEMLGYMYAIITEYFSPYGVTKHQYNPTTKKCDLPFNFHSIVRDLPKRLFVTMDIAAFVLSMMQYQFVRIDSSSAFRTLSMFFMQHYFPHTFKPIKVVCYEKAEEIPDGVYDPIHHTDPIALTHVISNHPKFAIVNQQLSSITGNISVRYNPNYYRVKVVTERSQTPIEAFTQMLFGNTMSALTEIEIVKDELTKLSTNSKGGLYRCHYEYPDRTETFRATLGNKIDISASIGLDENRRDKSWKARMYKFPKKMRILRVVQDENHSNVHHIDILRQCLDAQIGAGSAHGAMKLALERVIRRIPEVDHDVILAEMHYGYGINRGGKTVKHQHNGLFEVTRTSQRLYSNESWWIAQQQKAKRGPIKIQNQMPVLPDEIRLLSDGISSDFDNQAKETFGNPVASAFYYNIDENLDTIVAKKAAKENYVQYREYVHPDHTLRSITAIQHKWAKARGGRVTPPSRIYPDAIRKDRVEAKRVRLGFRTARFKTPPLADLCEKRVQEVMQTIRSGETDYRISNGKDPDENFEDVFDTRINPKSREESDVLARRDEAEVTEVLYSYDKNILLEARKADRLRALLDGHMTLRDVMSAYPPLEDEKDDPAIQMLLKYADKHSFSRMNPSEEEIKIMDQKRQEHRDRIAPLIRQYQRQLGMPVSTRMPVQFMDYAKRNFSSLIAHRLKQISDDIEGDGITMGDMMQDIFDAEHINRLPKEFINTPVNKMIAEMKNDYQAWLKRTIRNIPLDRVDDMTAAIRHAMRNICLSETMFYSCMKEWMERTDEVSVQGCLRRIQGAYAENVSKVYKQAAKEIKQEDRFEKYIKGVRKIDKRRDTPIGEMFDSSKKRTIWLDLTTGILVEHSNRPITPRDGIEEVPVSLETFSKAFYDHFPRNYVFQIPSVKYLPALKAYVKQNMNKPVTGKMKEIRREKVIAKDLRKLEIFLRKICLTSLVNDVKDVKRLRMGTPGCSVRVSAISGGDEAFTVTKLSRRMCKYEAWFKDIIKLASQRAPDIFNQFNPKVERMPDQPYHKGHGSYIYGYAHDGSVFFDPKKDLANYKEHRKIVTKANRETLKKIVMDPDTWDKDEDPVYTINKFNLTEAKDYNERLKQRRADEYTAALMRCDPVVQRRVRKRLDRENKGNFQFGLFSQHSGSEDEEPMEEVVNGDEEGSSTSIRK